MRPAACPVCAALDGFHDESPHSAAAAAIPAELRRPSNTAVRRQERDRAARLVDIERRTVCGIRPHLPRTLEQDQQELRAAMQWLRDNPMTQQDVDRLMDQLRAELDG